MIPRLGDGNHIMIHCIGSSRRYISLENDSPSRGRKLDGIVTKTFEQYGLENDSPSRGRKRKNADNGGAVKGLENDSPSRGRKRNM